LEDLKTVENDTNNYLLLTPDLSYDCKSDSNKFKIIYTKYPVRIKALHLFIYEQIIILKYLNAIKPDVFITPYYDIPYLYKGKIIASVHDLSLMEYGAYYPLRFRVYYSALLKQTIKKASHIITISNYSKTEIIKRFNYPENKITVLHIRISSAFRCIPKNDNNIDRCSTKYSIPKEYIFYAGGYDYRKNVDNMIIAYMNLVEQHKNILPIVLTGKVKFHSSKLFNKIGKYLNTQIYVPGYIDINDMPYLYNNSIFTIYPSLYEGTGLPLLESIACGKTVACSDLLVFRELCEDIPIYFNPLDIKDIEYKIYTLLDDTAYRKKKESKTFAVASKYKNINNGKSLINIMNGLS
jgi:glycosyltransferase involved in cell wall biosynthesis